MAITNGYCTLAELKAALRISDTVDDSLLEPAIESASRLIDGHCQRVFYNAGTATRVYVATYRDLVYTDDIAGTALTLKTSTDEDGVFDVTWKTSDYQLEPVNGLVAGAASPYTRIRAIDNHWFPHGSIAAVQVTATYGWPSVPSAVKQACVIQSSRLFKRLDSPLGVAGFGDIGIMRVDRGLDSDVAQLLGPFVKFPHGVA